jgi:hypothetical protein
MTTRGPAISEFERKFAQKKLNEGAAKSQIPRLVREEVLRHSELLQKKSKKKHELPATLTHQILKWYNENPNKARDRQSLLKGEARAIDSDSLLF